MSTRTTPNAHRRKSRRRHAALMTLAAAVLAAPPAVAGGGDPTPPAPVQTRTTHIIEWDLPADMDASPGAMVVDSQGYDKDRLFFVTRIGIPRVFRMNPWKSPMKGSAQWTSWQLAEDSFTTGGLRRLKASHDRRYLVVRTATSVQRIDIQNCSGLNGTRSMRRPCSPQASTRPRRSRAITFSA